MTNYICNSCDKKFHYKEFYDNHRISCEFFSQNRKRFSSDNDENIPSNEEMFRFIQHLSLKCHTLTEEIEKLKKHCYSSNKKVTETVLGCLKPSITFDDWIKSFKVSNECMTKIFENDLTSGIINCIHHKLRTEHTDYIRPIHYFKERTGILYIYQGNIDKITCKWTICSNEHLHSAVENIKHEITKYYCDWRKEQTNIDIDVDMSYLTKISGSKINKNKQIQEIKSWIISNINI